MEGGAVKVAVAKEEEVVKVAAALAAAIKPALALAVSASARNAARRYRMLLVSVVWTRSALIVGSR